MITKMEADTIIFAGTNKEEEGQMTPSNTRIIKIKKIGEVEKEMGFLSKKFDGEIRSRMEDVIPSLIYAKQNNLRLVIDEKAPPFEKKLPRGDHMIVVQREKDLADVIAANYVFSCNAALTIVEGISDNLHDRVERHLDQVGMLLESKPDEALVALEEVRSNLRLMPESTLKHFKSITFITTGVPYGIAHDAVPVCHIRRFPDLGRFLFNCIWMEEAQWSVGSSIVFAPYEKLSPDETNFVINIFTRELNYACEPLIGETGNVDNFKMFAGFYPYDILHICSHGGSDGGFYTTFEWNDKGERHVIEAYEIINRDVDKAKPDENDMIEVGSKFIFVSFDGEPWNNSPKKRKCITTDRKFFDMVHNKKDISRGRVDHVPDSNRLRCYDGWYFAALHEVEMHPIVFNNSCCSAFDLGYSFIYAGARCYIGTAWLVDNDLATDVACDFYRNIHTMPLLEAFWLATNRGEKSVFRNKNFLFIGTHFSTLCKPEQHPLINLLEYLPNRVLTWQKRLESTHYPKAWKKTFQKARDFLLERMEAIDEMLPDAEKIADSVMPIMRVVARARIKIHNKCEPCEIKEAHKSEITKEILKLLF